MGYTPGPWKIKHEQNVVAESGRGIASCGGYTTNDPEEWETVIEENLANTRLIAAAPEMYEALRQCKHILDTIAIGMAYDLLNKVVTNVLSKAEPPITKEEV